MPRRTGSTDSVSPADVEAARREFVEAQARLEQSSVRLRGVLEAVEESTRLGTGHIESGAPALELPDVLGLIDLRARLADALSSFDAARLVTRTANMRLAVWEGASASEIARRYGVSRQYASRLLAQS